MVTVSLQMTVYHVVMFSMFWSFWTLVLGQLGKKGVLGVTFCVFKFLMNDKEVMSLYFILLFRMNNGFLHVLKFQSTYRSATE